MGPQSRTRQRIVLALKAIAGLLLIAVLSGALYEQLGERRDRRILPQVGRSIDIGGRALNIHCSGTGAPAAIFDSGNGDPGIIWSDIQTEIAKSTRACWYDRAGDGWSDPGPYPRTSEAMAKDLHELLQRAGVPRPYVLVGHSLGGLNARVYNGLYPNDVAGAVLVDAAHEDEPRRAPAFMLGRTAPRELWRPIWHSGQTARVLGMIRLLTPRADLPSEATQRTNHQLVDALRQQPKSLANHFNATLQESYAQAERAGRFGDRPLIVLTRGNARLPENASAMDREWIAYEKVWMHEIQPKLARLSSRGRQIIVEESGHRMHEEAPDAVIAAVRDVLADVRRDARPANPP